MEEEDAVTDDENRSFLTDQNRAGDRRRRVVQTLLPDQVGVTNSTLALAAAHLTVTHWLTARWRVWPSGCCRATQRLDWRVAASANATTRRILDIWSLSSGAADPECTTMVKPLLGQMPQGVPVTADAPSEAFGTGGGGTGQRQPDFLVVAQREMFNTENFHWKKGRFKRQNSWKGLMKTLKYFSGTDNKSVILFYLKNPSFSVGKRSAALTNNYSNERLQNSNICSLLDAAV